MPCTSKVRSSRRSCPGTHRVEYLRVPADGVPAYFAHPAVRLVTLAPELPGALELARELDARGVVVSLGHSDATPEQAGAVPARMVTHLFNAMRTPHHRRPTLPTWALLHDSVAVGLIPDGAARRPARAATRAPARRRPRRPRLRREPGDGCARGRVLAPGHPDPPRRRRVPQRTAARSPAARSTSPRASGATRASPARRSARRSWPPPTGRRGSPASAARSSPATPADLVTLDEDGPRPARHARRRVGALELEPLAGAQDAVRLPEPLALARERFGRRGVELEHARSASAPRGRRASRARAARPRSPSMLPTLPLIGTSASSTSCAGGSIASVSPAW